MAEPSDPLCYDDACNLEPWRLGPGLKAGDPVDITAMIDELADRDPGPAGSEWRIDPALLRREGDENQSLWVVGYGDIFDEGPERPWFALTRWQRFKWRIRRWRFDLEDWAMNGWRYRVYRAWRMLRHGY